MHTATLESNAYPALLKPQDIAQRLNISRAMAYKLLATGEVPTVRMGDPTDSRRDLAACA